ncbi:ulp1 protease family, C-terminal catalytic domain-containing protein [Tanacetum coccineum]
MVFITSLWRGSDVGYISKNEEARDDPEFKVKENEEASHSGDPEFKVNENEEASHSDGFLLSTQQVRELINDVFDMPLLGPNSVQVKNDLDDVHNDSVVKYAEESENPRQKFPVNIEKVSKRVFKTVVGSDGNEIQLLPWKEDLTRSLTAPKRTVSVLEAVMVLFCDKNRIEMRWTFPWLDKGHLVQIMFWEKLFGRSHTKRGWLSSDHLDIWIEYLWQFRDPNADWAMESPYLCYMLSRFEYPLYYGDGVTYGVPWFTDNVQKVYFPINENDSDWVLGELHIIFGLITISDSLGAPPNGKETRHFWLQLREKLMFQILLYLDNAKVFEKKNINKDNYLITFR